jgi:hypothetical protein
LNPEITKNSLIGIRPETRLLKMLILSIPKTGVVTVTMEKSLIQIKLDRYSRENEIDKQCQIHALFTRKT